MDTIFLLRKSIIYFGYLVLLINVILYSISYKKKPIAFKYIYLYLVLSIIIQFISAYLASKKLNNLLYFHIFNIGQFILISLLFINILKNKVLKIILKYSLFVIPFFLILFFILNPKSLKVFNIVEILFCSIPLIISSFLFFVEKIDSKNRKYIYFNSGFFLYTLCSTLLFCAGNLSNKTLRLLWLFNSFIYLMFQIMIFIEWYKNFRKKTY